jgi:hypothetical protein
MERRPGLLRLIRDLKKITIYEGGKNIAGATAAE